MSDFLLAVPVVVQALLTVVVVGYTCNALYLALLGWRGRSPDPPPLDEFPFVTVALPIYNELYVARRVIDAAARLDWPADRLEIQVLDDSTDETRSVVREA